jgi:hypothetical protein
LETLFLLQIVTSVTFGIKTNKKTSTQNKSDKRRKKV